MKYIRSLIFFIFLNLWTVVIFCAGLLTYILKQQHLTMKLGSIWSNGLMHAMRIICNVHFEISGEKNIPSGTFLVASKHESIIETIFLSGYFEGATFIMKKQLSYIPLYGQYLILMDMIFIDRLGGLKTLKKMIKKTTEQYYSGRKVVIFPEGTRVAPGSTQSLKGGLFAIHQALPNEKILPIYISSGHIWPPKSFVINPGTVKISFKKPVQGPFSKTELLEKISIFINSPST